MYQYDDPTCALALPAPAAPGTPGYFTDGNPGGGVAATELRSDFMNMLMMELLNVVSASGQTPSKTAYNQVLSALEACFSPPVGQAVNLTMSVPAASSSATMTADEIVVKSALGGLPFLLKNFNKTINLATTGAGGMDTGASPASAWIGIYAIFNPTTGAAALLGTLASAAVAPNVYGGANMPAGYTASALVSVVPTNASGQILPLYQTGRYVGRQPVGLLGTSTDGGTVWNAIGISGFAPKNAKFFYGYMTASSTVAGTWNLGIGGDATGTGNQTTNLAGSSGGSVNASRIPITNPQNIYAFYHNIGGGTLSFSFNGSGYEF